MNVFSRQHSYKCDPILTREENRSSCKKNVCLRAGYFNVRVIAILFHVFVREFCKHEILPTFFNLQVL